VLAAPVLIVSCSVQAILKLALPKTIYHNHVGNTFGWSRLSMSLFVGPELYMKILVSKCHLNDGVRAIADLAGTFSLAKSVCSFGFLLHCVDSVCSLVMDACQ